MAAALNETTIVVSPQQGEAVPLVIKNSPVGRAWGQVREGRAVFSTAPMAELQGLAVAVEEMALGVKAGRFGGEEIGVVTKAALEVGREVLAAMGEAPSYFEEHKTVLIRAVGQLEGKGDDKARARNSAPRQSSESQIPKKRSIGPVVYGTIVPGATNRFGRVKKEGDGSPGGGRASGRGDGGSSGSGEGVVKIPPLAEAAGAVSEFAPFIPKKMSVSGAGGPQIIQIPQALRGESRVVPAFGSSGGEQKVVVMPAPVGSPPQVVMVPQPSGGPGLVTSGAGGGKKKFSLRPIGERIVGVAKKVGGPAKEALTGTGGLLFVGARGGFEGGTAFGIKGAQNIAKSVKEGPQDRQLISEMAEINEETRKAMMEEERARMAFTQAVGEQLLNSELRAEDFDPKGVLADLNVARERAERGRTAEDVLQEADEAIERANQTMAALRRELGKADELAVDQPGQDGFGVALAQAMTEGQREKADDLGPGDLGLGDFKEDLRKMKDKASGLIEEYVANGRLIPEDEAVVLRKDWGKLNGQWPEKNGRFRQFLKVENGLRDKAAGAEAVNESVTEDGFQQGLESDSLQLGDGRDLSSGPQAIEVAWQETSSTETSGESQASGAKEKKE